MGLLGLMSQMLRASAADQHFMLRRHGFAILAFLLHNYVSPGLWTVAAISACVQLTSCFASTEHLHHEAVTCRAVPCTIGRSAAWCAVHRHGVACACAMPRAMPCTTQVTLLFGQPRLWVFTRLEVQLEVYEVLHQLVERKPRAFLAKGASGEPLLSIQALVDILQHFYWHAPSAAAYGRTPLRHAISGEVMGERPDAEGLRRLRARVLQLVQLLAASLLRLGLG